VNTAMPYYVVQRTMEALNTQKKTLNGARLLVMGAAYKKDVDDVRESPSLRIMALLQERGAVVDYHDPYVAHLPSGHGLKKEMDSVELRPAMIQGYDGVLILTDHSGIDYEKLVEAARLVVDTRNATAGVRIGRDKITKA